jgi:nitrogen-specific signal transduction histidine kinase
MHCATNIFASPTTAFELKTNRSMQSGFRTHLDPLLPKVNVVTQDIGRVVLNLINNAFYAVSEKSKQNARLDDAVGRGNNFLPTVSVSTKTSGDKIQISVTDNGNGIP